MNIQTHLLYTNVPYLSKFWRKKKEKKKQHFTACCLQKLLRVANSDEPDQKLHSVASAASDLSLHHFAQAYLSQYFGYIGYATFTINIWAPLFKTILALNFEKVHFTTWWLQSLANSVDLQHLIWVYTVSSDMYVWILKVNMVKSGKRKKFSGVKQWHL